MADKETGLNIPVSAVADKDSAKIALNELTKSVLSSLKDGYIEVPAEIKASYTRGSKELEKAQKDVIKSYEKMSKEGFSSSVEELDELIGKYKKFKSLAGKEGKANSKQTKWLTKTIGETLQPYLTQKRELEKVIAGFEASVAKVEKTTKKTNIKKPRNLGPHSKEEIDANIKQHKNRQYKGVESTGPRGLKTTSGIDAGRTNEHLARLSEYSAHGSNWANELAKTLKEEVAKSAKTLVTYIDPSYAKNTKGGRATTEQEFLTDTIKSVRTQLRKAIIELEAGSEDVTLDTLKEHAAVIKVLNSELGKTTEDTMKMINNVIQKQYTQSEKKRLGGTSLAEGQEKGVGPGHENAQALVSQLFKSMKQWDAEVVSERIAKEIVLANNKTTSQKVSSDKNSLANKKIGEVTNQLQQTNSKLEKQVSTAKDATSATEKQTNYDLLENSAERVADTKEGKANREIIDSIQEDTTTGMNTEANTTKLFGKLDDIYNAITSDKTPTTPETSKVSNTSENTISEANNLPDLYRYFENGKWKTSQISEDVYPGLKFKEDKTDHQKLYKIHAKRISDQAETERGKPFVSYSQDIFSKINKKDILGILKKVFGVNHKQTEAERIMSMSREQQEDLLAKRRERWGIADTSHNVTSAGDKIKVARSKSLWRSKNGDIDNSTNPFKDLQFTEGVKFDSKAISEALQTMIERNQFKAQTGGGFWKNVGGAATFYLGQDSLEKTRAQAEGLNEVMSIIKNAAHELLESINVEETALRGMKKSGSAIFREDGSLDTEASSNEAIITAAKAEELKDRLRGVLAEAAMADDVVESVKGNTKEVIQQLSFAAPELQKCNTILKYLGSGLNKNGKALNFQKRTQEILNYSYQLMARHIGQVFKNLMMWLNPLNLIKKAFNDFTSYSVKWQRTMNVIKYNIRRIIEPFMEWIAQQLVNIIGLINAIAKGIGQAFGKDWDLFDQSAANAEKMKEELEAASNVTSSLDELHDVGSDDSGANDLLGDIYTPQWDDLYSTVTEKVKALTEKLIPLFKGIGDVLEWCLKHWKLLVAAWATFKIAKGLLSLLDWGSKLSNLFGITLPGTFSTLLKGLGWLAAGVSAVVSTYETVKLGTKWDQMDDEEKNSTIGKSIGFGTLAGGLVGGLLGGPAGAAIGAGLGAAITGGIDSAISDYNGDDARAEITGAIGGAGIGATIGTLIAPGIGTAVGAAIGAGVGWGVEKLGHLTFSNGGDYSNLKISTEDLAWANEQLASAQDTAYESMYNLKLMEEQTGESGKQLYDAVKNGVLSYDNMSSSQLAVYKAYEQNLEILDDLHKAQQTQMDYETSMDMDRAKKTDNYKSYIEKMIQANQDGVYSNEELEDRFAQMYGELDRGSRQAFLEQLPENMRSGVETAGREYMSNWSKFYDDCCVGWENFTESVSQTWENIKTGVSEKWTDFKTGWGEFWGGVKTTASEKWEDLKTSAKDTWENIKTSANNIWTDIKESAIGQKVKSIWEDTKTKFSEVKKSLTDDWNTLKTTASTVWGNIKDSIVDSAKNAWNGAKDFFSKIGEGISDTWENLKKLASETGQKLGNWISGNGYKTNAEVASVSAYAVGTNYVPSDGLAYLHQGEAVIPKKYNQPYQPTGISAEEQAYMRQMMTTLNRLDSTLQQGINVSGEFRQRGTDLVAVTEKAKNRNGHQPLNNPVFAR